MTLQLELGKKYLNRRGEVVEINEYGRPESLCPWYGSDNQSYTEDGKWYPDEENPEDLVSEYVEPSAKPAETNNKTPHKHGTSVPNSLGTKVPHLHADLIIAWAQGETIEYLDEEDGEFYFTGKPSWDNDTVYRIKPEKKVDVEEVMQIQINPTGLDGFGSKYKTCNIRVVFKDGEAVSAEVF